MRVRTRYYTVSNKQAGLYKQVLGRAAFFSYSMKKCEKFRLLHEKSKIKSNRSGKTQKFIREAARLLDRREYFYETEF